MAPRGRGSGRPLPTASRLLRGQAERLPVPGSPTEGSPEGPCARVGRAKPSLAPTTTRTPFRPTGHGHASLHFPRVCISDPSLRAFRATVLFQCLDPRCPRGPAGGSPSSLPTRKSLVPTAAVPVLLGGTHSVLNAPPPPNPTPPAVPPQYSHVEASPLPPWPSRGPAPGGKPIPCPLHYVRTRREAAQRAPTRNHAGTPLSEP